MKNLISAAMLLLCLQSFGQNNGPLVNPVSKIYTTNEFGRDAASVTILHGSTVKMPDLPGTVGQVLTKNADGSIGLSTPSAGGATVTTDPASTSNAQPFAAATTKSLILSSQLAAINASILRANARMDSLSAVVKAQAVLIAKAKSDSTLNAASFNLAYGNGLTVANGTLVVNDAYINSLIAAANGTSLSMPTLSISNITANSLTATIGSVTNATTYTLQQSLTSDFANATTVGTPGSTLVYNISGLNPATQYYFRAKDANANYASGYTVVNATTLVPAGPTYTEFKKLDFSESANIINNDTGTIFFGNDNGTKIHSGNGGQLYINSGVLDCYPNNYGKYYFELPYSPRFLAGYTYRMTITGNNAPTYITIDSDATTIPANKVGNNLSSIN